MSPRSFFQTGQRFPLPKHFTSGCMSPRSLFPPGQRYPIPLPVMTSLDQSEATIFPIRAYITTLMLVKIRRVVAGRVSGAVKEKMIFFLFAVHCNKTKNRQPRDFCSNNFSSPEFLLVTARLPRSLRTLSTRFTDTHKIEYCA